MKLGIIAVYLSTEDSKAFLALHMEYIRKVTTTEYVIFGGVKQDDLEWRQTVSTYPDIVQCELPTAPKNHPNEHAYFLDYLTTLALKKDCSHIVTLHLDSFPISRGWNETLLKLSEDDLTCVAAIDFPTSCLFFSKRFYEKYQPPFFYNSPSAEFLKFCEEHQQLNHSGTSFLFTAHQNGLPYFLLTREINNRATNHDDIYSNLIYHLGGAVRCSIKHTIKKKPPSKSLFFLNEFFKMKC